MLHSILKDTKISIQALKSADNETLTGATLDMQGYDSVTFIVGALQGEALSFSIKAQQDSDSAMGSAADLAGTSVAFTTGASADGLTALEIHGVQERYCRALVIVPNAAAATPTFCIAIQWNAKTAPYASAVGEVHNSPAEGTA